MASQLQVPPAAKSAGFRARWRSFRRSTAGSVLVNLVAAVVVIALVQTFFVKMYVVPSGSMQGTLLIGDRILVNRTAYAGGVPPRGDVVVFSASGDWNESPQQAGNPAKEVLRHFGDLTGIGPSHEKFMVKRVIGIPGDVVECCTAAGALKVNGLAQDEPYVQGEPPFSLDGPNCETTPLSTRCFGPFTVPDGQLLVLGDNRGNSKDSVHACRGRAADASCLKLVPLQNVIGHTFATVLPLQRFGSVD